MGKIGTCNFSHNPHNGNDLKYSYYLTEKCHLKGGSKTSGSLDSLKMHFSYVSANLERK